MKRSVWLTPLLLAIACGSSDAPPAASPSTGGSTPAAAHEEAEKSEHHRLTPELDAFHQLLSPLWHADKGEARRKDTCAALADFKARAAAVKSAAPPSAVHGEAWSNAGVELETAVGGLASACGGSDMAVFESAFEEVHTRFHHAMELVMGEHDMQGEHAGDHEGRGEHEAGAGHGRKEADH